MDCNKDYCASGFYTFGMNGTYSYNGTYHNGMPVYYNGFFYLWYVYYDFTYRWIVSQHVSDIPTAWYSVKSAALGCPNGTYQTEAGTMTTGACT